MSSNFSNISKVILKKSKLIHKNLNKIKREEKNCLKPLKKQDKKKAHWKKNYCKNRDKNKEKPNNKHTEKHCKKELNEKTRLNMYIYLFELIDFVLKKNREKY